MVTLAKAVVPVAGRLLQVIEPSLQLVSEQANADVVTVADVVALKRPKSRSFTLEADETALVSNFRYVQRLFPVEPFRTCRFVAWPKFWFL
jgi:hypothetical protein